MVFSKVKWGCTTTEAINSENLTKMDDVIDCSCEKPAEEVKIKPKTCINCCAPLHSNVCEYCGSVYELDENSNHVQKGRQIDAYTYELDILGEKHLFYVGNIECIETEFDSYRDVDGYLHRVPPITKRKLTLIEY